MEVLQVLLTGFVVLIVTQGIKILQVRGIDFSGNKAKILAGVVSAVTAAVPVAYAWLMSVVPVDYHAHVNVLLTAILGFLTASGFYGFKPE